MDPAAGDASRSFLHACYDRLWLESIERLRAGAIEIDPNLARGQGDARRGLTLLFRPPQPVRDRIVAFLDELRALEPGQHVYHPDELHVTCLSLFTATVHPASFARTPEYIAAVEAAVPELAPFSIRFEGVTASPGAIMLRGFTDIRALNRGRDRLRRELQARGLGDTLDARYRLEAAHMTVLRFRAPLQNPPVFVQKLEAARLRDFGTGEIYTLELVKSDWYQSRAATERVLTCRLR